MPGCRRRPLLSGACSSSAARTTSLPASTQWDIVARAAKLVTPAFEELVRQAAQGDVLHNDDIPVKILELMKKKQKKEKGDDG